MKNGMVFSSSRKRDRPLLGAGLIGCSVCNRLKYFNSLILRSHLVVIPGLIFYSR